MKIHQARQLKTLLVSLSISARLSSSGFAQPQAWDALWQNRVPEAKKLFEAKLAASPDDGEALRGLGWIASLRSDNVAIEYQWKNGIGLNKRHSSLFVRNQNFGGIWTLRVQHSCEEKTRS